MVRLLAFLAVFLPTLVYGSAVTDCDERTDKTFVRGDANGDGNANVSDLSVISNFLHQGGTVATCDGADTNDDGCINDSDVIYLAAYLYQQGSPPPTPFPSPGNDGTNADGLDQCCGIPAANPLSGSHPHGS